ncbi:hypothetical protein, partial [Streptomyces scabiei]|uniref:hypothetical protein n=1 Tax=Streptomyces scabiei TaxID=1930 RepID=UPI0029ABAF35
LSVFCLFLLSSIPYALSCFFFKGEKGYEVLGGFVGLELFLEDRGEPARGVSGVPRTGRLGRAPPCSAAIRRDPS